MKTDNNNTDNLSLKNVAQTSFELIKDCQINNLFKTGFLQGANWQKEKDKDTINKLVEALKKAISVKDFNDYEKEWGLEWDRAWDNAIQLLQQIQKEKQ